MKMIEGFKIYFLKGDSLMIHKKSLCTFVLISFLFSSENIVAMLNRKPVVAKETVVPLNYAIYKLMAQFMNCEFGLILDGDNMNQSMQDQWERFIKHYPREMDLRNVSNSLNALYGSFVKKITGFRGNNKRFEVLLKNSNINNRSLKLMPLDDFLNQDQVKAAFIVLGRDVAKDMQPISGNPDTLPGSGSIITPPPVSAPGEPKLRIKTSPDSEEEEMVQLLTDPELDPKSPKAIEVAKEFLGLDKKQISDRDEIERIVDERLEEIKEMFADQPKKEETLKQAADIAKNILERQIDNPSEDSEEEEMVQLLTSSKLDSKSLKVIEAAAKFLKLNEEQIKSKDEIEQVVAKKLQEIQLVQNPVKQEKLARAAEVAKDILEYQIDNPNVSSGVSEAFRQTVADRANLIAQTLLSDNISEVTSNNIMKALQKANIIIWGIKENSNKMAYLMGYVQSCVWNLPLQSLSKNISGDQAQVISRVAEVLKTINKQLAHRA